MSLYEILSISIAFSVLIVAIIKELRERSKSQEQKE